MTYKQIEASREARLWIGQVVVPVVIATGILLSNPEVSNWVTRKVQMVKTTVKMLRSR